MIKVGKLFIMYLIVEILIILPIIVYILCITVLYLVSILGRY